MSKSSKVKSNVKVDSKWTIDYNVLTEAISKDNVLKMAEAITSQELKFLVQYIGTTMIKMANDLYCDIINQNQINYVLSDSYDLVQAVALCLCEHLGKNLNDIVSIKKNKPVTIRIVCTKIIAKELHPAIRSAQRHISIDKLDYCISDTKLDIEQDLYDYTTFDNIVTSLNLTNNMKTALDHRMSGLSYPQIGKMLNRTQSTVYDYFIKMRQRYIKIYGEI